MLSSHLSSGLLSLLLFLLPLVHAQDRHRVVYYYQTFFTNSDKTAETTLLPLINDPANIPVTHVLVAAVHIVDAFNGIQLNDFAPENEIFDHVWSEVAQLQAAGVKIMAMVGGANPGSWDRLDGTAEEFEKYYVPLRDFVGEYNLQGLDLDVEQSMSLEGMIRLIDRLRADFGPDFIISLSPVASALTESGGNLSGFSYFDLEAQRGGDVGFYNCQFYNNWGQADDPNEYYDILFDGFPASKVIMGMLSNGANGNGFVPVTTTSRDVITEIAAAEPEFGGVAAWEYFNSLPGGTAEPWLWAGLMRDYIATGAGSASTSSASVAAAQEKQKEPEQADDEVPDLDEYLGSPEYLAGRAIRDAQRIAWKEYWEEHHEMPPVPDPGS